MRKYLVLPILLAGVLLQFCTSHENKIVKPILPGCGTHVVEGYTDKISYFPGDEMNVFLQSNTAIECGLGIYDIKGSLVQTSDVSLFQQSISTDEPWAKGFKYKSNGEVVISSSLASGMYYIEKTVPFVVKSTKPADITVVYPINTLNAYNPAGGKSLYTYNSTDLIATPIGSFLRPIEVTLQQGYCNECLKWLPTLPGITINYISDLDLDDFASVSYSKVIVIVGHSEYWTRKARESFDRFVDNGGHAVILSGNTMWWQVRYSHSRDALICYKDASSDPETDLSIKTILWTEPALNYPILPSIGADFNHGGYGIYQDNGWDGYKITNPNSPLLEGTNLKKGEILSVVTGEYDGSPLSGFDSDGFPIIDKASLNFEKIELIGFDRGSRGGKETIPTFVVFQKTKTSGIIVNAASYSWCSNTGIGSDKSGPQIKLITKNSILKLLNGENVFTEQ